MHKGRLIREKVPRYENCRLTACSIVERVDINAELVARLKTPTRCAIVTLLYPRMGHSQALSSKYSSAELPRREFIGGYLTSCSISWTFFACPGSLAEARL